LRLSSFQLEAAQDFTLKALFAGEEERLCLTKRFEIRR